MPVNSKKLQRIIAKAKKVDYVKSVRIKRIVTGISATVIAGGVVGGAAYGFWYLSQKSTKPAFVPNSSNTNDQILGPEPFCGTDATNGGSSIGCYAGQIRLTSSYPNLVTEARLKQIAVWVRDNINRGPEGAVISNVKFASGVDSSVGIILGYRTQSKDDSSILMSPDAQDWIQNIARSALDDQAAELYKDKLTNAASDFDQLMNQIFAPNKADTIIPRVASSGAVDTTTDIGLALRNLRYASLSLSNWDADVSTTNLLQTVYKMLFRTAYNRLPATLSTYNNADFYDLAATDDYGIFYDRALVSALVNAPDSLFKNSAGQSLASYYVGKGIDFKTDVLGSLAKLNDLHADLMQNDTGLGVTNSEFSRSAFVTAGKTLADYIAAHPTITTTSGTADSATLLKPLLDALFQDNTLAKASFVSYSDAQSVYRSRGANKDVAPGVSSLQPLLFSNYNTLAGRFINPTKTNIPPELANVTQDTVSYNVNNPEVMSYSPTVDDLGKTIADGSWFGNADFYKKFSDGLFVKLFSDMAYTLSHEYGHHYTIWNTQSGEPGDFTNVFSENMDPTPMNRSARNALLEAETNGGSLDNWDTAGGDVNIYGLKNLLMASDASNATSTGWWMVYDPIGTLPQFSNSSGANNLLSFSTGENHQLWVTTKGGVGTPGTDYLYYNYIRFLLDLVDQAYYGSSWTRATDAIARQTGTTLATPPAKFDDYLNALYPTASPEKSYVKTLLDSLDAEIKKPSEARSENNIAFLFNQVTSQVYFDAQNNASSPTVSTGMPSIVEKIDANTTAVTDTYPLAAKKAEFIEQREKIPAFKFGDPYLSSQASSLGFGNGGSSLYNYVYGDYYLQFMENLTRLWQVLTLPVDERAEANRNKAPYVAKNSTEEDNSYLRAIGVYLYDEKTSELTETGKRVLDFYRSISGLVVDPVTHQVIDAQQLHEFNILKNNGMSEASGWIKKEDAQNVVALKFTNRANGSVTQTKVYFDNVAKSHYYSKLYVEDGTSGNYYRDPASLQTDFSGDYVQWQTDYFVVGDYSNSPLQQGDYDISFVMKDGTDSPQLTKMLNSSTFNALADNGKAVSPNSFGTNFSNFYFVLVDGKVTLHVKGTTN